METVTKEVKERAHHPYSPSSLQYREVCPKFQNDPVAGPAALKGTELHNAVENEDFEDMDGYDEHLASLCLEYVQKLHSQFLGELKKEVTLNCFGVTEGFADAVLIKDKEAHIIDYKFGWVEVTDAEFNLQGIAYALGVMHDFAVEKVTVHFIMPRINQITIHTFSSKDIAALLTRVQTVIARAQDPDAPENPHYEVCTYCFRKAKCEPLQRKVLQIGPKFTKIDPSDVPGLPTSDPSSLAKILKFLTLMGTFTKSMRSHITQLVVQNDVKEIPGYMLSTRSAERVVMNPTQVFKTLEPLGVSSVEFENLKTISMSDVDDLIKVKAPKGKKTVLVEEKNKELIDNGAVSKGQPTLFLRAVK